MTAIGIYLLAFQVVMLSLDGKATKDFKEYKEIKPPTPRVWTAGQLGFPPNIRLLPPPVSN